VVEGERLMRHHTPAALKSARQLRSGMSLPEVLLWRFLRQRPLGLKFRRQHPVGNWVADFYCDSAKTIIEIDGIAHEMGERPARDSERDQSLRLSGFHVIRIPAADVLQNLEAAAETIVSACIAAPPPSALRAATSPDGGGLEGKET